MNEKTIPYRITIELAVGPNGTGKTIQVTGETPAVGDMAVDAHLTAMAANALLWQSHAMSTIACQHAEWQKAVDLYNAPVKGKPN